MARRLTTISSLILPGIHPEIQNQEIPGSIPGVFIFEQVLHNLFGNMR